MRTLLVAAALVFAVACQKTSDPAEQSAKTVAARAAAPVAKAPELVAAAAPAAAAPAAPAACCSGGSCNGNGAGETACGGCQAGGQCAGMMMAVPEAKPIPKDAQWTELKVEGMHCGGCARRIQSALAGVDGVYGCEVDLGNHAVKVAMRPGADAKKLAVPAIDQLGYHVVE